MTTNRFCEITHELQHLSKLSEQCARIDPALYAKYDVKRGLRASFKLQTVPSILNT